MNKLEKAKEEFIDKWGIDEWHETLKELNDLIELACEEKDEEIERLKKKLNTLYSKIEKMVGIYNHQLHMNKSSQEDK